MKLGRISVASMAALAAIGLAACGSGSPAGSSGGGAATAGGGGEAVKVGIKFDQPGMGLEEGPTYSGFDVDLANYIAKELNYTPSFVEAVSSQRETLLKTGQVKYIVGTYSITDARKKDVDFAGPYFIAGQDLLIRSDDTSITSPDSLAGKKLCSVKGSTSAVNVQKKVPGVNLQEYNTYTLCVDALKAKNVDALTTDNTILAGYAAQPANKGQLKVVGQTFSTENYGVGLPKGDTAFCQQGHRRYQQVDQLRRMAEGGREEPRPVGLQARRGQPAEARRVRSVERRHWLSSGTDTWGMPPTHPGWAAYLPSVGHDVTCDATEAPRRTLMGELLSPVQRPRRVRHDVAVDLLRRPSASLVVGTIMAILRVSPVAVAAAGGGASTSTSSGIHR